MNRDDILGIREKKLYDNGIIRVYCFNDYPNQHSVMILDKYLYLGDGVAKMWAKSDIETINAEYEKMVGIDYNKLNPAIPITELKYALSEVFKRDS